MLNSQEKISDLETKIIMIVEHARNLEDDDYSEDINGPGNFNIKPTAMSNRQPNMNKPGMQGMSPPRTGGTNSSKGKRSLEGIGQTMTLVDNLKENFRTSFAKKTEIEEIEKTVDIISKFTIQDEHKKKKENDR